MQISFHFQHQIKIQHRKLLKSFINQLITKENLDFTSLSFVFCTDEFLLSINRQFLKHNFLTDIITFNLGSPALIEGEIYISVDRIKENSPLYKTTINEEMHRLIFHGILHLFGYNDKSSAEKSIMKKMEEKLLNRYKLFVSRGT